MPTRREFLTAAPLLTSLGSLGAEPIQKSITKGHASDLKVMTYNLRYANSKGPDSWPERRPAMQALLQRHAPDVFGTQEGLYSQLRDIAADLPDYDWIGLGRDGGSRGEFMAIFFRKERLTPLAYDHFWLSDTPDVIGSSTWGNTNRRMLTSAHFKDRKTGVDFHLWNTHLDHALQTAREKAAELIRSRIAKVPADQRVLLLGDFNAVARQNPAYDRLTRDAGLTDTWYAAKTRQNEDLNSFNGFKTPVHQSARIDWILLRGPAVVHSTEVISFTLNGRLPSDHFPVEIQMSWI